MTVRYSPLLSVTARRLSIAFRDQVSVTVGDDHDTNKSSYLLNLFTDEARAYL